MPSFLTPRGATLSPPNPLAAGGVQAAARTPVSASPSLQHPQAAEGATAPRLRRARPPGPPDRAAELQVPVAPLPGLPEAEGGRGGSGGDPAEEPGVHLGRKKGGGQGCEETLSARHHERGSGCEAVRFQDDRGQRAGHESAAHGQGDGEFASAPSSRANPPSLTIARHIPLEDLVLKGFGRRIGSVRNLKVVFSLPSRFSD